MACALWLCGFEVAPGMHIALHAHLAEHVHEHAHTWHRPRGLQHGHGHGAGEAHAHAHAAGEAHAHAAGEARERRASGRQIDAPYQGPAPHGEHSIAHRGVAAARPQPALPVLLPATARMLPRDIVKTNAPRSRRPLSVVARGPPAWS